MILLFEYQRTAVDTIKEEDGSKVVLIDFMKFLSDARRSVFYLASARNDKLFDLLYAVDVCKKKSPTTF